MPTIDEIFETMPAEASVNYEELTIDAESRQILVPEAEKIFGVESDTQAERKHFRCPRYVGAGLDLAGCFIRVNFRNANGEVDAYLVTDVVIDGENITFSWELSRKVTAYKGEVQFVVCAVMGSGLPEWNTTLAVGEVLEGLEPDSSTVEAETADVIAQLLAMVAAQTSAVEAVGAAQCDEVREVGENTTEEAKAAVEAKGAAVVASIPADYTALSNTVDRLTRDRAAAIVCEAEGEIIQVNDSSADPLVGLRLFGKSTQDGTPTPEAPVDIVSAKAPVVTVCGKNFAKANRDGELSSKGLTLKQTAGSSQLKVEGTATAATSITAMRGIQLSAGEYTVSVRGLNIINDVYDRLYITDADENVLINYVTAAKPLTFKVEKSTVCALTIIFAEGSAYTDATVNIQIERGDTATDYDPYCGGTLTLSTPDSLPGIPVTSGGNYTDANGQQWIADEVDLARGVYVQRVGVVEYDGSADEPWEAHASIVSGFCVTESVNVYINKTTVFALCNKYTQRVYDKITGAGHGVFGIGAYGSKVRKIFINTSCSTIEEWRAHIAAGPLTVVYLLAEPIETTLSTEEIEAYKALLANKPTTTVLNDAGAWMALEYAADPKTYIDNKIAALLAANN